MLTRVVKMTFRKEGILPFKQLFNEKKSLIRSSDGCLGLKLLQSMEDDRIFFTVSLWQDDHSLQKYRKSSLFAQTWAITKSLFDEKAQAWSLDELFDVPKTQD